MITLYPPKKGPEVMIVYWSLDCWGRRGKERELQVLSPARKKGQQDSLHVRET